MMRGDLVILVLWDQGMGDDARVSDSGRKVGSTEDYGLRLTSRGGAFGAAGIELRCQVVRGARRLRVERKRRVGMEGGGCGIKGVVEVVVAVVRWWRRRKVRREER
ncbi:hypothetical protein LIER_00669 [Lithospermum erythrorhizon]|uniref:Uncharacterized protein n=1 Tax=Lithospermum erythrorhizon TaxID=34254 RepID=A0AAV3NJA4_LITER